MVVSPTGTAQYLVVDDATKAAVIIDPVLDYDADSGKTSTTNADKMCALVKAQGARVDFILETHCHADHITSAILLRERLGQDHKIKLAIGEGITKVQATFKSFFNLTHLRDDGSQWDQLFKDGDEIRFGASVIRVLSTPGHTVDSITYELVGGGLFVGDTVFAPDKGSARCDFPGGDAATLHSSIKRILSYPPETKIYLCHDYPGDARPFKFETSVQEELQHNIHLQPGTDFINMRKTRDATLKVPHLLVPSVQLNVDAGQLPPPESNGTSYIKVPINKL